jgi:hypothetical protein
MRLKVKGRYSVEGNDLYCLFSVYKGEIYPTDQIVVTDIIGKIIEFSLIRDNVVIRKRLYGALR